MYLVYIWNKGSWPIKLLKIIWKFKYRYRLTWNFKYRNRYQLKFGIDLSLISGYNTSMMHGIFNKWNWIRSSPKILVTVLLLHRILNKFIRTHPYRKNIFSFLVTVLLWCMGLIELYAWKKYYCLWLYNYYEAGDFENINRHFFFQKRVIGNIIFLSQYFGSSFKTSGELVLIGNTFRVLVYSKNIENFHLYDEIPKSSMIQLHLQIFMWFIFVNSLNYWLYQIPFSHPRLNITLPAPLSPNSLINDLSVWNMVWMIFRCPQTIDDIKPHVVFRLDI